MPNAEDPEGRYEPHDPVQTLLHSVVRQQLEPFLGLRALTEPFESAPSARSYSLLNGRASSEALAAISTKKHAGAKLLR
jgi:hypothetical protein